MGLGNGHNDRVPREMKAVSGRESLGLQQLQVRGLGHRMLVEGSPLGSEDCVSGS